MRGLVGDPDSRWDRCADAGAASATDRHERGCAMLDPVDRHKPLLTFRPDRHRHDSCSQGVISWIDLKDFYSRRTLASSC